MTRPKCCRQIAKIPDKNYFKPKGITASELEVVLLSLDELEAVRLADFEGFYQEQAARRMNISRPTFGRVIASAHKKIADCLINGKALKIEGGEIAVKEIVEEKEKRMKIALPSRSDQVDAHFGHCEHFTVFTIGPDNKVTAQETVTPPPGCGCKSDIALTLEQMGVKVMLAGNMGQGALNVLGGHGIRVVRGCSGSVTDVVENWLSGNVKDSGLSCVQHGHACHEALWGDYGKITANRNHRKEIA